MGIALGSGSDIAVESADVVLMRSNLTEVLLVFALSKVNLLFLLLLFFLINGSFQLLPSSEYPYRLYFNALRSISFGHLDTI